MKGVISGVMKRNDAPMIRTTNNTKRMGVRRTLQYQMINVTNAKTDKAAKIKTRVKTNQLATVLLRYLPGGQRTNRRLQ